MLTSARWAGTPVLVTGHTGFKGGWLVAWLARLGAVVTGLSQPPEHAHALHRLGAGRCEERIGDIRDAAFVSSVLSERQPEVVFHLAAQPLVRRSYQDPVGTYSTNVTGTATVLDAAARCPSVRAAVVVTSDKVYDPAGPRPYTESSRLGGTDPYSSSKACTELVAACFRSGFFAPAGRSLATARAGNVLGGGDWSADRLVPDLLRAHRDGRPLELRYPDATRPWQHVLDPLHGYLLLAEHLLDHPGGGEPALNFGPGLEASVPVREVVDRLSKILGQGPAWRPAPGEHPHEAPALTLDSRRSTDVLGWRPVLELDDCLEWTARWYRTEAEGGALAALTDEQISQFQDRAAAA